MDKQISNGQSTSSSVFLTGAILLANLDFTGMLDYAVKATIGGAIWLGFKLTADYLERRKAKRK